MNWCYFNVFVLYLCLFVTRSLQQSCPVEYSPSDSEVPFQWISSNKTNYEIVFSNPVCFNNDEHAAFKVCMKDRWSRPSTPCYHYDRFQQNFNKNVFQPCYFITLRRPWNRCILPQTNLCPSDHNYVTTLWMPYKRTEKYGPFVSTILGETYGKEIKKNIKIETPVFSDDFFKKQCLYLNTTSDLISLDYCESLHSLNCTLEEELNNVLCPKNCILSLKSQACICKINAKDCKGQPYAAVENLNQKYLLHKLANRRGCYLGGTMNKLREAINNQLWFYTDQNLECSFCVQNRRNCRDTDLVLNFHESQKALYLTLYQPNCVLGLGNPSMIYCFTDASDALKKRVDIQEFFQSDQFIVYKIELEELVGNYWCTAHSAPVGSRELQSNKILASKRKHNEFSVMVSVKNLCTTNCINHENYAFKYEFLVEEITNKTGPYNFTVRVMDVTTFNDLSVLLLLHMTSMNHTYACHLNSSEAYEDYKKLSKILLDLSNNTQIIFYRSSEFCFNENFQGLSWPTSRANNVATPKEFCVSENGIPVFRACVGNFLSGYIWSDVYGQCYSETPSHHTEQLKEAAGKPIGVEQLKHVSNVTRKASKNLQVMDIYYIAEILSNVSAGLNKTVDVVNDTLNIIDGVLGAPSENVKEAQIMMNLTDEIMLLTEDISSSLPLENDVDLLTKKNLIFHVFNPFKSDTAGFVLYQNKTIKDIKVNEMFNYIEDINNILLAMYVPTEIIDDLLSKNLTNTSISTTVFLNDKFVSSSENLSSGIVVNVNIPPYKAYLPSNLPILFRHDTNDTAHFSCAYWDLGDGFQRRKGDWSNIGSTYSGELANNSRLQVCSYAHLTHFGLLVLETPNDLSRSDVNIINFLTVVGCILSIIGILGIFVTAYLYNKWRERTGTQILLHLSTATLLEIVFMYLNGWDLMSCRFSGMILYYVILCKFSWMLVYAYCQYLRFIRVIGPMPTQLVLKSVVFGWGAPLLPVVIVSVLNPVTYDNAENNFCYPSGNSLHFGLYLPVATILCINLFIFIRIFIYLSNNSISDTKISQEQQYKLHKRLFILLFFVLGVPWVFGLMANIVQVNFVKSILTMIFTAASSLQGFVMFLFYVILNKETRDFWRRSFKKYEVSEYEKHTSSGSIS